jgi:hypothetical protein
MYLIWIWVFPMLPSLFADMGIQVGWYVAAWMCVTFMAGATGGGQTACREHRILPVTERDLWVTEWLHATLLVPASLLILKLGGLAWYSVSRSGRPYVSAETLLLSTVFDIVFAGVMVAVPFITEHWQTERRRISPSVPDLTVVPILLGIGTPLLMARSLPTRFVDFTPLGLLVLVIGIVLALAALAWTPKQGVNRILYRATQKAPASPPAGKPRFADRFTGIFSVAWAHVLSTFLYTVIAYGAVIATWPLFPDPAASDTRFPTFMFLIFAMTGATMGSTWSSWARRLKVLPLSVKHVSGLFVLTPLVTWIEIWLILLFVHAVMGWPIREEMRPHSVLMYAGLTSLSHALQQRFYGLVHVRGICGMLGIAGAMAAAMNLFGKPTFSTRLSVIAIGILSFVLAAVINHYTFTRSTSSASAYRRLGVA